MSTYIQRNMKNKKKEEEELKRGIKYVPVEEESSPWRGAVKEELDG